MNLPGRWRPIYGKNAGKWRETPAEALSRVRGVPRSSPPTLHELQADLPPEERGIGRVVAEVAAKRVVLIDEGSGLIEEVIHAEIALGVSDPALPVVDAVTEVQVDRRPRIDAPRWH